MNTRSTKEELCSRIRYAQEIGHIFSKQADLVHHLKDKFNISPQAARKYVREAYPKGFLNPTTIKRQLLKSGDEVFYYLAKVTEYVKDEISINQLLRMQFLITQQDANAYLDEFKKSESRWGEKWTKFNRAAREEAYAYRNRKTNQGEWPSPSFFLCTDCDNRAEHYHHPNYAYPHWVEPVCSTCHTRIHTILYQRLLD